MADGLAFLANLFTVVLGGWALREIVISEARKRRRRARKQRRGSR